MSLKRVGRDYYERQTAVYKRVLQRQGELASLNERRLASLLEEVLWETKQFSRDVATAWFRRTRV